MSAGERIGTAKMRNGSNSKQSSWYYYYTLFESLSDWIVSNNFTNISHVSAVSRRYVVRTILTYLFDYFRVATENERKSYYNSLSVSFTRCTSSKRPRKGLFVPSNQFSVSVATLQPLWGKFNVYQNSELGTIATTGRIGIAGLRF